MKISVIIPVYGVEKYIGETLQSIKKQTFQDYEVIIVNDDSPDNSQTVIDEFCMNDSRFKSYIKINEGVSAARNYGIDRATGEYVFFVDGDDLVPERALEAMYCKAKEMQADMVIGAMQEKGIYGEPVYAHSKELAAKKEIDIYDPALPWTFSVCNKLLKKSIMDEFKLRFEKIRHTEDGLFMFQFLFHCKKIVGCNEVVYFYRKRSFWEERSATQAVTVAHLKDLVCGMDKILELANEQVNERIKEISEKNDNIYASIVEEKCKMEIFLSKLHHRILEVNLINEFYRQVWKNDEGIYDLLKESIDKYKHGVFPSMWKEIVERNKDLRLEEGILTKEELCLRPLITVAISDKVPVESINTIIESIYNQQMPAFKIFVHGKNEQYINSVYLKRKNIQIYDEKMSTAEFKNSVLDATNSTYVLYVDEQIYSNINTYRVMYNWMEEHKKTDVCCCRVRTIKGEKTDACRPQNITYLKKYNSSNTRTVFHCFDWTSANKLMRTDSLKKKNFKFTNDTRKDAIKCFKKLTFKTLNNTYVLTPLTEKNILQNTQNMWCRLMWRVFYYEARIREEDCRKTIKRKLKALYYSFFYKIKKIFIQLIPVQKKVLFVSIRGNQLLENAKAVYDAYEGKKVVFDKPYPHSSKDKLKLYWHLFSSKVIVTDDYFRYFRMFELKKKQKIIQIWHACGAFKKFGLDYPSNNIKKEIKTHRQYDSVIVSAESIRDKYAKAFGIEVERIKALGVPRTDKLLDKKYLESEKRSFYEKYPLYEGKEIILYAPTFRDCEGKRVELCPKINWEAASDFLGDNKLLIIKNHPVMNYDLLKGKTFKNIINMPKELTSRLMIISDVIITDYSSVVFEAVLLNKPMVFYCPDFDSYERDFYLNFPDDLYGEFTRNQQELLNAIEKSIENPDKDGMQKFKEKYMGSCDGNSTSRVVELIKEKLKE